MTGTKNHEPDYSVVIYFFSIALIAIGFVFVFSYLFVDQEELSIEPSGPQNYAPNASPGLSESKAVAADEIYDDALLASPKSVALEIIQDVDQNDLIDSRDAWDAGYKKISGVDPQRILRWRPVLVDARELFAQFLSENPEPADLLTITIFPGEPIVARNTGFRSNPQSESMSWSGVPEDGEFGSISIHILPETSPSDLRALIHITTRFQDFHVMPTEDHRYYVAVETYRGAPMKRH
jgi:hypothetical protein